MNEQQLPAVVNPFANAPVIAAPISALTSVDQQRAIAEVQAHMLVARSMPRDPKRAMDLILNDCMVPALAEDAAYQYARGGNDISGPSIKLAEAAARRWGNIRSGIEEISRGATGSECRAYAWDLETGFYDERKFHVKHWRDTKRGGYQITDERDIYELIANMGQRRKRAVLLAIIPGHVMDAALSQCELTLKSKADITPEGLKKLVATFAKYDVTQAQIEAKIQRRLDAITPAQYIMLQRIYVSMRDGMSVPGDWFDAAPEQGSPPPPQPPSAEGGSTQAVEQGAAAPQPKSPPAPTGRGAKLKDKVKGATPAPAAQAGVVQTEGPPTTSTPEVTAGGHQVVGGDAGSTPATGSKNADVAQTRYLDYVAALDAADSPEAVEEVLNKSANDQLITPEMFKKLRKHADEMGG